MDNHMGWPSPYTSIMSHSTKLKISSILICRYCSEQRICVSISMGERTSE